jgi:hypothetical protein
MTSCWLFFLNCSKTRILVGNITKAIHARHVASSAKINLPFRKEQKIHHLVQIYFTVALCAKTYQGVQLSLRVYHTCSNVTRDAVAPSDAFYDKSRMRGKIIRLNEYYCLTHRHVASNAAFKNNLSLPGIVSWATYLYFLSFAVSRLLTLCDIYTHCWAAPAKRAMRNSHC